MARNVNPHAKESSFVSGNQPGENFFILTRSQSRMYIRIYIFNFKKQTNKQTKNKNTKIEKETKDKEEKRISLENLFKKINLPLPR